MFLAKTHELTLWRNCVEPTCFVQVSDATLKHNFIKIVKSFEAILRKP